MKLNKKKTFRKKKLTKYSKKSFKKSLKNRRTLRKVSKKRKMLVSKKRTMHKKRKLRGGKLNPLVPLPLREFGDVVRNTIEETNDVYNGTDHAIDISPVEGHFQHNF